MRKLLLFFSLSLFLTVSSQAQNVVFEELGDCANSTGTLGSGNSAFDYSINTQGKDSVLFYNEADNPLSGCASMMFIAPDSNVFNRFNSVSKSDWSGSQADLASLRIKFMIENHENGSFYLALGNGGNFDSGVSQHSLDAAQMFFVIVSRQDTLKYMDSSGDMQTFPTDVITLGDAFEEGEVYEMWIIANSTGATVDYTGGSVTDGNMDVFLNGVLIADDMDMADNTDYDSFKIGTYDGAEPYIAAAGDPSLKYRWWVDDIVIYAGTDAVGPFTEIEGDAGWRLLAYPSTGTFDDLSGDDIGAQFTGDSDASIQTYDDTGAWEPLASSGTAIVPGLGYATYFFDNSATSGTDLPLALGVEGVESLEDVEVDLYNGTGNGAGSAPGQGPTTSQYTLVGNPFSFGFDLNEITATGDGIQDNVYFWDNDGGGGTYTLGSRDDPFIVAPYQGFWVEILTAETSTSLTFPVDDGKTTSAITAAYFEKSLATRADIAFELSGEGTLDKAIKLAFRDYATFEYDRADAGKLVPLTSKYATMAFKTDHGLQGVNSLPYNLEEEIMLDLEPHFVGVDGEFTFAWSGMESIPTEWELTLHDYQEGQTVDMRSAGEYTFTAEMQAKASSNPQTVLKGPAAVTQVSKAKDGTRFGITIRPTSSVSTEPGDSPARFALHQNYPNPFNPSTVISYQVPENGLVTLEVYDLMGRKVAELVNSVKAGGEHNVTWNATGMSSGMYYYRLTAAGQTMTRKMTLIK